MTLLQLQVLNWWSFSYIISANLFALLFHFLLNDDLRMTTFTHQLLSRKTSTREVWQCECKYSSLSATLSVTGRSAEVVFIQPGGKLDTMWRDDWQRLASSYPTSRWDMAVNLITTAGRCSLSHRQKHKNLQLVDCSSPSQTFCPPNSPDFDTVNCHLVCNSADGLPSSRFLLSWQN